MRTVLALLLFVALAVVGWLWSTDRATPMPPAAPPSSPSTAAAATAASTASSAASAAPRPPGPDDSPAAPRTVAPVVFTGPTAEVQVVLATTREPVAGADVLVQPPDFDFRTMGAELQELARRDHTGFLRRIAPPLVSDADGRCRVPLGTHGTGVTVVMGELWGQGVVPKAPEGTTVIALQIDRTLHVRVVDAGGQPAPAVRVLLRRTQGEQPASWQLAATDADGRTRHLHVQALAADVPAATLDAIAQIPGGESAPVAFDPTAPPPEVLLRLPRGGTVVVRVRDAEDRPLDPGLLGNPVVRLATWGERPADRNAENEGLNRAGDGAPIDGDGEAVFGTVAFGCQVMADVGWTLRSAIVPGPTLTEPRVLLVVRESADTVVLAGRLLGEDGQPLARNGYMLSCHYSAGMSGQNGRTAADGRFRIAMGGFPVDQEATVSIDTRPGGSGPPLALELPPRRLQKGVNDLGDVRLAAPQVLVQGRVTGGTPQQVQLQLERQRDGRWQQEWNLHPEWQDDGRFAIRGGIPRGTPLRLAVQARAFLPVAPIVIEAGATGLEIALHQGASAEATFLVDDGVPIDRLTFRLRVPQADGRRDLGDDLHERMLRRFGDKPVGGRFRQRWSGLAAGSYRLQVLCEGVAEPLVAIDAIELADGPCTDPRLTDIDLRGRLRTLEVRVVDAAGAPLRSRDAHVVVRSAGPQWSGFHLGEGAVKLAAPGALDLLVIAPRHVAAFVDGVAEARTIQLEAAPAVALRVELPSPLPDGAELRFELRPRLSLPKATRLTLDSGRGMMAASFFGDEVVVGADGRGTWHARFAGPHTVGGTLSRGGRGGMSLSGFTPREVTAPAAGEVGLRITAKDWQGLLDAAGR